MVEWGNRKMIDKTYVLNKIFKIFFGILVIGALFWVLFMHFGKQNGLTIKTEAIILGGKNPIYVSIADSREEQEKGLSNTSFLAKNTGEIFIFDTPDTYGFWMKDMNYALDLVWIGEDMTIVEVTRNLTPETYPKVFYPSQKVKYVLEINQGVAEKNGLSTGTKLRLQTN